MVRREQSRINRVAENGKHARLVGAIDPRAFGLVRAAYSVRETLELLSIGRTSLYEAVKRGELSPVKFGKKLCSTLMIL
jgi:hypothetical protein